jgi:hypothetical protein
MSEFPNSEGAEHNPAETKETSETRNLEVTQLEQKVLAIGLREYFKILDRGLMLPDFGDGESDRKNHMEIANSLLHRLED